MSSTSATSEERTDGGDELPSAPRAGDVARANLFHILSRAFAPVADMDASDPARLQSVGKDDVPALREASLAAAAAWEGALADRKALSVVYARLFLGPFEILAPPYASLYLDPNQQLMGETSRYVAQAYADSGLEPGDGPREAPDHITHELEFMYFLGYQWITIGDPAWTARRRRFWDDHLGRWLPPFANAIRQADAHACYTRLADLLLALTVAETRHDSPGRG